MEKCNIEQTAFSQLRSLRAEYFDSLPEFQELFLELMASKSKCYVFKIKDDVAGYVIVNDDGVMVEFYLKPKYVSISSTVFKLALSGLSVKSVFCKTFDSLLLGNCMKSGFAYSVIGLLYRDYTEPQLERDLNVQMEKAGVSSREIILGQDESLKELYETEELLNQFLLNESVFLFHKGAELIGCGMVIKTVCDWDYCDLGVWVNPNNRGCGFGAQILMKLRAFALGENLKPSCGCALENVASQKTIEKCGFVSRHQLIEFKPPEG